MKIGVIINSFRCEFEKAVLKAKEVGADGIQEELFGNMPDWKVLDQNNIALTVKAHQTYFMQCKMKGKV